MRRLLFPAALYVLWTPAFSQLSPPMDPSAIRLALHKMRVLGSLLYVGAHPDDENTAFLAAMARGRLARTAYLSITRGEGGQNLIGPEQGRALGIVRTRELLAARRIDGAEQYFTRAIDFGYSKTTEETLRFWGHDQTLADVVWVIRLFQPDVIVTRFTPTAGGHGNHTASALLAHEAWSASGDTTRFPDQLATVRPWKPRRVFWNVFRGGQDTRTPTPGVMTIDLGAYSPLLGKSFTELAGEARTMHKSQGFGAAQNRGEMLNGLQITAGDTARLDPFEGIDIGWGRIPGGAPVDSLLADVLLRFDDESPSASLPGLFAVQRAIQRLAPSVWTAVKLDELAAIIRSCTGLWVEALAADPVANPGNTATVTVHTLNRSPYPLLVKRVALGSVSLDPGVRLEKNRLRRDTVAIRLPADAEYTQPFWLRTKATAGSYGPTSSADAGRAMGRNPLSATVLFEGPDGTLACTVPVLGKRVDPVEGEIYRPFTILPPVALRFADPVLLFPDSRSRKAQVAVRSTAGDVSGTLRLELPEGWHVEPPSIPFRLENGTEERSYTFTITPRSGAATGDATAAAEIGGRIIRHSIITVEHPHIPLVTLLEPAEAKLIRTPVAVRPGNVGYVMGSGDEVPQALKMLGLEVTLLSDADLDEGDLSRYDVIITGVRAHNTRPRLRAARGRLMDYVSAGGTYVVQYVTTTRREAENLGPWPLNISRERVTEEDAPVKFLAPSHPLLRDPNRIAESDFEGWVQERGLYFADRWDPRYDSLLSCADAGEPQRSGGLLAARYGKGCFAYTGFAFFRQLPAGVPGAYRLLANIVSLRGRRGGRP